MAEQPDLSLPDRVPEMEQYHDLPKKILPFAFYTLCDLDGERFEGYRRLCVTECDDGMVKLPPQARFVGESLQSIMTYHVELGRGGQFDPSSFIVCVYRDSTSVVVVTLDEDDLECKPDLLWIKMDESGLLLVNLQIANGDWFEAKEADLGGPTWLEHGDGCDILGGGDDDSEDHHDDDEDVQDYGKPTAGFHIQLYTIPGLDDGSLIREIEPVSYLKNADRSDWVCRLHRLPSAALTDPLKYAANLHPHQCAKHPTLQKQYFIVADQLNYREEGMAITRIDWDGNVSGKTKEQLLALGHSLAVQTQRADAPDTGSRAAVGTLCMLAQGYERWQPEVRQFAIYYANSSDADIKTASATDARWGRSGHGEARVALGGSMLPVEIERGGGFWPALIRRHFAYCKRQKFVPTFVRDYFFWCSDENPSGDSEVQLIKLDWNGDLQQVKTFVKEYETRATATKTTASKAHKELMDVVDGKFAWKGGAFTL